jgi:hypothetical protein
MKMTKTLAAITTVVVTAIAPIAISTAHADPVVATACAEGGCTAINPALGAAIIAAGIFKKNIADNFEASKNEPGELGKVIRATTGISPDAIREHGLAGGENSEVRRAGRFFANIFGW